MKKAVSLVVISLLIGFFGGAVFYSPTLGTTPVAREPQIIASQVSVPRPNVDTVHTLVNAERTKLGLPSLEISPLLVESSKLKCNDIVKKDYWSHIAPDGTEPWSFFRDAGYDYLEAGENLANDYVDSEDLVTGWMNSPTHKANIINANYREVGYSLCSSPEFQGTGQTFIVVQHFGLR